jgi:hypothetical protein
VSQSRDIISIFAIAVKPFIFRGLTMTAQPLQTPRFIRKTQLAPSEYRKNFHQIDRDVMAVITSAEADQVTQLMSKIYLRLVNAPQGYWEREGVLRIEAEVRGEKLVTAWAGLCDLAGVASATASKALKWMHGQGIIGYFSGKNGAGIRIFFNRAASSIGVRTDSGRKKILEFSPASQDKARTSRNEAAFNDSYAVRESLDLDIKPRAPKNGAEQVMVVKNLSEPSLAFAANHYSNSGPIATSPGQTPEVLSIENVIGRLKAELEPAMHAAARQAAAQEHERTREWLENRGLPKAVRVAQHEAYNVLRQNGVVSLKDERARADLKVGCSDYTQAEAAKPLSAEEIKTYAEICVAMLEIHGQEIDVTISELSVEASGPILPEDAPKVRIEAERMIDSFCRKSSEMSANNASECV